MLVVSGYWHKKRPSRLLAQKSSFLFYPSPVSEVTGPTCSYNIKLEHVFSVSHETEILSSVTCNDVVN